MLNLFRREKSYRDLEPQEVQTALSGGTDIQLIDVRSRGEFVQGHLPGAKLIPLPELASRLETLRRDRPVIVYCLSGARSAGAARHLAASGFHDVSHLKGGVRRWPGRLVK